MQGSVNRFITEWQTPSVLLVRVGAPFVAGLYDVHPQTHKNERVTAVAIDLKSAAVSTLNSVGRHASLQAVQLALCFLLNKAGMTSAATEGETSDRHHNFSAYQILRALQIVPEPVLDAFSPARRSPPEELQRFTAAATGELTPNDVFKSYLQRHAVANAAVIVHTSILYWITRRIAPKTDYARYLLDVDIERVGVPVRKWQLQAVCGRAIVRTLGAAIGASVGAVLFARKQESSSPSSSSSSSENNNSSSFNSCSPFGAIGMLAGEMVGSIVAITAFSALFIKYRPLEAEAMEEERHHDAALFWQTAKA